MPEKLSSWYLLAACFAVAALAGLTHQAKSGKITRWLITVATMGHTGFCGLMIGLLMLSAGQDAWMTLALCVLVGLCGSPFVDFIVATIAKGGVTIVIQPSDTPKDDGR